MLSAYRRLHWYAGEIGSLYNVIQDPTHQVSMRLKLGILSDHNGTYIVRPLSLSGTQCADVCHCCLYLGFAWQAELHAMLYRACCRESPRPMTERHCFLQDGLGFAYQGHKIVIELVNGDH